MGNNTHFDEDGDLPPPYSPSANTSSSIPAQQHLDPQSYSSIISSQVANLRAQISASQAYRASVTDDRDSYVLSIIFPLVDEFISSISEIYPTPRLAEATLVPDAAVSDGWRFNDEDDKRDGEYKTLIRVCEEAKKKDGNDEKKQWPPEKGSSSNSVNDGTSSTLWWESEGTALRLAKHLQPQRPASSSTDAQAPKDRSSKKSGLRGLFKRSEDAPQTIASKEERPVERVTMTTRAEEVTFRKENEFGIWETKTGWGIILRVRMHSS